MRTNDLPKNVRKEFQEFDFENVARMVVKSGLKYSIIIDDDGSLYWEHNVDRVARGNKSLVVVDCPYYPEPVNYEKEVKSLTRDIRQMVYDKIMSIPDSYWKR